MVARAGRLWGRGGHRLPVAALLALCLLFAACGDDGDESDAAPTSSTPSESTVPAEPTTTTTSAVAASGVLAYATGSDGSDQRRQPDGTVASFVIAFDTGSLETVAEAQLPWTPSQALAVFDGSVWVGTDRETEGNLLRLDATTLAVQGTVSAGGFVFELRTDGTSLLALTVDGIHRIEAGTNAIGPLLPLYLDQFPDAFRVSGGKLYAVFGVRDGLMLGVYDAATGAEEAVVPAGDGLQSSDVEVVDGVAWLSLRYDGGVVRVDPQAAQVLGTTAVFDPSPLDPSGQPEGRVFDLALIGGTVVAHSGDQVVPLTADAAGDPILAGSDEGLFGLDESRALGLSFGNATMVDLEAGTADPLELTLLGKSPELGNFGVVAVVPAGT